MWIHEYFCFNLFPLFSVAKLILYILCRRVKVPSTRALAMDHRNDTLSNAIAIVCGYIGEFSNYKKK